MDENSNDDTSNFISPLIIVGHMDNPTIRDSVGFQLMHAHKQYTNYFIESPGEPDLNLGQELVIAQLAETDGVSQSTLAEALSVKPPSITTIVQNLEEDGLIERRENPDDARARLVFLTHEGESMIAPIEARWSRGEKVMLDGFTTEERLLLRRMLIQIQENIDISDEADK